MATAKVIGTINLSEQATKLEKRIELALKDRWLDSSTHFRFKKELQASSGDVKALESLLQKVSKELTWRKRTFGTAAEL